MGILSTAFFDTEYEEYNYTKSQDQSVQGLCVLPERNIDQGLFPTVLLKPMALSL